VDFADEPYVRLYTRKTLTHKLLGWEGRAVMRLMLDEFDASGVFAIRGDAARCISAVTEMPVELVRVGLERLLETETWIVTAQAVTWPTYEEAQHCTRSNRLRQLEFRRRRAEESRVSRVTSSNATVSRDVTLGGDRRYESNPPLPSHPTHPIETSPGARAQGANPEPAPRSSPEPITDIRAVGFAGVARTYSIRGLPAPQSYLDSALMAGVGREQALATWQHYATKGLPPDGVEDLEPWMVLQAKGFVQRRAKAAPRPPAGPPPPPKGKPAAQGIAEWQAEEARLAALADAEREQRRGGAR
jgi:hypothetical protein